jgi:cytochrome P450
MLSLSLIVFGLAAGLGLLTIRLFISYLRLSKIPGPFAAKFTDLWRFRSQNTAGHAQRLVELHRKHGKLVRLGPNHVSISDPSAISTVYSISPTWVKGPSYYGAMPISKNGPVPSIISMSEAQHTAVRKSVGRGFTTNSLLDYESCIETSCYELIDILKSRAQVDINEWLQLFAMDMIIRIAFTDSLGMLTHGKDVDGSLAAVMDRFDHWGQWGAVPSLDYALNKSRLATMLRGARSSPLARVAQERLAVRRADKAQNQFKDLCSKVLDGQQKSQLLRDDDVLGIIMSTIGAGADTTAATLTYTVYFLSKYSLARKRLRQEIDECLAAGTLSPLPKWNEVSKMEYLDAVLKESMRLCPVASWGLDRVVAPEGATISGQFIPGGTVVGCQIDAIHRDTGVFGADAEIYRPERWLEAGEEQRRAMNRAFLAFSAGKRTCTGIHIAWLEMKKTLPLLMIHFDVRPQPIHTLCSAYTDWRDSSIS